MSDAIKNSVELGDVIEMVMGQAPPGDACNKDGAGKIFVKAGEFQSRFPLVREWTTKPLKHAKPGDTLVCVVGATAGKVNLSDLECAIGRSVAAVRALPEKLDPLYLFHFLRTKVGQLRAGSQGAAQGVITREMIARLGLYYPPLPEQRRIAAILDQADALRAKRREALAQLDSLTQSIFIEMFGDPVLNPHGFPVASLTDVCQCYSGGTPSKANADFWEGNVPWFSAKDMKASDLFDSQDHIHESVTQTTNLKLLPPNTVAIVVRGMILAHTFPVCVLRIPATINQDLKALIPRQGVETQFLAYCLRSQSKAVLEKVSEAGHGTKRLDAEGLGQIKVLLPGEGLQRTFATRIQAVESLKATHRAALAESDALFASLQHRAFSGQL